MSLTLIRGEPRVTVRVSASVRVRAVNVSGGAINLNQNVTMIMTGHVESPNPHLECNTDGGRVVPNPNPNSGPNDDRA